MKTNIYAVYLPDSTSPAYIGSHASEAPERSPALQWRYAHCRYLGVGAWLYPDGTLSLPRMCEATLWGVKLRTMTPDELRALRVEVLSTVDEADRWRAEGEAIRQHMPPFNAICRTSPDERRAKVNAYMRGYRKSYYASRPEKAEAKRAVDRERARARRAAAKATVA